jgi:phosphate acyltransferase
MAKKRSSKLRPTDAAGLIEGGHWILTSQLVIALDAMGGDRAPQIVVRGAEIARERHPTVRFLMFGDEAQISPLLARYPELSKVTTLRHTDGIIRSGDKPSAALRTGRDSSMWMAIDAVSSGEANAVISAGNTGALMVIARFVLKMLPGIDRPAICGFFPTARGVTAMLDLGANVRCNAKNLSQFAVMGEVFARTVMGLERPTIGLVNVGVEDLKGVEEVREAAAILRATDLPIEFKGFIEGTDIAAGTVDVVVTDGFTGNVALKTAEGIVKLYAGFLREAFRENIFSKIGYFFVRRSIAKLRERIDPREYNGAMLLGLNGIVVKSHGGTDALGFANAIGVGIDMALHCFIEEMKHDFASLGIAETSQPREAANL